MAEAAAPVIAESLIAESFAVAAPTMFAETALAPIAAGALESSAAGMLGNYAFGEGAAGLLGESLLGEGAAGLLGEGATGLLGDGILGAVGTEIPVTKASMAADVLAGGAGAGGGGINAAQVAAEQAKALEIANSGLSTSPLGPANPEYLNAARGAQTLVDTAPIVEQTAGQGLKGSMMNAPTTGTGYEIQKPLTEGLNYEGGIKNALSPSQTQLPNQYSLNKGLNYSSPMSQIAPAAPAPTGLEAGFNKALQFAKDSPFSAGSMALNAFQYLNKEEKGTPEKEEYNGILTKYKMSPDFQGRYADPADYQYTPKVYNMAEGGIASYKAGSRVSSDEAAMDYYTRMTKPRATLERGDAGIYYDQDPDTRYQDALTAAQIRMAKVNKRANMQTPNMKRPTPMGQINMVPTTMRSNSSDSDMTEAAQGGIMRTGLGGYAAGGNPRLLRGPGDGMSDNIPATIAGKQPARLADGEFVIPADVVSHLGNGSTEAGAKVLHAMMTKVRKARTGNPKQGKQIKPNKFIPR